MRALTFDQYERLSEGGGTVPVFREIPGDLLTPVSAFLAFAKGARHAFLLESVVGGERLARYSFLGRDPEATIVAHGQGVLVKDAAGTREEAKSLFTTIRERLATKAAEVAGLPRFTGGAVGYMGYDAVRLFERIPDRHPPSSLPLASFAFYRSLVAFDHVAQRLVLIAHAAPGSRAAFDAARARLDSMEADLREKPAPLSSAVSPPPAYAGELENGAGYEEAVRRAKEYIGIGDIFQVVLSRQATVPCDVDPFAVYRALRMVNPSPYMFFLRDGETSVAGASPEMLVRVENGQVEARPIAGTRPRGQTPEEDDRLAAELLADAKERAEHLMLVDLGRNDLGRVCRFGTVSVPEFMKIERYSHVAHIVSSVTGELAPDKDALDALAATFPAGTLSGAPKIRAMEIIDELEPARRGLYGGGIGYVDLRGNLDFCITIRTVVLRGGQAFVQAGAGIVADSDAAAAARETEAKAGAVFEALRLAGGLAR
jgi:anthranilate synthase component 1